ncbi:MAG: Type secretion system protein [Verrucomicrobiaceae bacterium]|nr:Type secretion system protein [Verrucomicrobiaceae bacterium]
MFLKPRLSFLLTPFMAVSLLSAQDAPKPGAPTPTAPAGSSANTPSAPTGPNADGQAPDGFRGRRRGGFGGPPGGLGEGGGAPEGATDDGPRINGNVVEPFQFPNNSVADLLAFYERLTGMTLIKDTAIFDGSPISLVTTKQVDKAEAIRLVEATLLVNGYAIVADPQGKSARILPTRAPGANTLQFSQGVKFYTDPKDIPEGETLVTYFMKLEHLTPDEAGQTLANHVGLNVFGRLTPVASPPGLLITESANIVRHLIGIRDVIDVAPTNSSLVTKFIKLIYADAPVVAQIVQATLDAQAKDKQTKGLTTIRGQGQERPRGNNNGPGGAPAAAPAAAPGGVSGGHLDASGQKTSVEPAAQVIADPRLNQILIVASPEDYTYVASLVQEFDKPVDVPEPFERKLNYVFSVDVLSSLSDLLKDTSTGVSQLPGGGTLNLNANQQPLLSSSSQLLAGRKSTNTRGATLATSGASAASTDSTSASTTPPSTTVADQLIPPQEDNAPISILVNKTRIIADPQSNTIFVMGSKEAVDKVSKLLDKLDKKPAQVYLATVIGELTLDNGLNYGIDYLSKFNSGGQNKGFSGSFIQQQPGIAGAITDVRNNLITAPFGPAAGFNVYGQLSNAVDVYVNALETTNKFKVLSRPTVFALNNKKASITSGSIIPVPSQSTTVPSNNGNGTVTTTVAFRQVVLKLEVVPLINPNNEITLTIAQINDTVTGSQRIEPNDVPIIGTEQIITTVTVPSGHTVVLGGLISETDKKATNGIPFISRIPVLGNLLKNTDNKFTRKELLIFIQPQVVADQAQLARASLNEDLRSKVGGDAYKAFPPQPLPVSSSGKDPSGLLPGERKGNWFQRTFGRKTIPERQVNPLRE